MAESWHLDKKVSVSMIGAIAMQTLMLGWWASALHGRVTELEKADVTFKQDLKDKQRLEDLRYESANTATNRIVRIETQLENVYSGLKRIETALDKIQRSSP